MCGIAAVVLAPQPDLVHDRERALAALATRTTAMDLERLLEQRTDGAAWIERRIRILEYHLHLRPQPAAQGAVRMRDVLTIQQQFARRRRLDHRHLPAQASTCRIPIRRQPRAYVDGRA
jgi:hypothetical protein